MVQKKRQRDFGQEDVKESGMEGIERFEELENK
jgi:hypothetical protein